MVDVRGNVADGRNCPAGVRNRMDLDMLRHGRPVRHSSSVKTLMTICHGSHGGIASAVTWMP